ncbi:winged helix-turn-helix transcriptional regulator [Marivirga sp.]|uniref:winged helix-turn-helix transcriptional regulator n=1 Tax=Marivirga sp. TaxID=2018662 RepID=UPI003DA74341
MEKDIAKVTPRCPIRTTLELVGGKWKLLIIIQLASEPKRLSKLKRDIPDISEKILIQELKNLVDSELVIRKNYGEVPPRVEYELTEKGKLALPLINHMKDFADQYLAK